MSIQLKQIRISEATKKCFLSIYVFLLIFSPPLIVPYSNLFLAVMSGIVLLTQDIKSSLRIAVQSGLLQWIASMTILALYVVSIPLFVSAVVGDIVNLRHYISIFNRYAVLIAVITPCSIFLIKAIKKYPYEYFIEIVAYAGLMEGLCSLLAYLFPSVKQMFISLMGRYSSIYENFWYITVRAYGFASTLVDLFGLAIALIAGVCFYYGLNNPKKRAYVLFSFVIAIAALLNARTGVIIFIAEMALAAYDILRSRHVGNVAFLLLLFVAAPGIAMFILSDVTIHAGTARWIQGDLTSVFRFLRTGNVDVLMSNGTLSTLFGSRFWHLPNFPRILIGTGHTLYKAEGYAHSDVGYVNELWFGGIVGYVLFYKDIVQMGYRLWKQRANRLMRFVGCYSVIAFLIFNIKAQAIGGNPGGIALFLLLFVSTYYAKRPKYDKSQALFYRLAIGAALTGGNAGKL